MKQKIHTVIFDLDNTLIDTEAIKEVFKDVAEEYGIPREEAWGAYLQAREDKQGNIKLTPETYTVELQEKFPDKGVELSGVYAMIDKRFKKPEDLLLPGAQELLEMCKKEGLNMYLLSLGIEEWQREKIERADLYKYFNNDQVQDEDDSESGEGEIIFTERVDEGKLDVLRDRVLEGGDGSGVVFFNDKPSKREADDILDAFSEIRILLRKDDRDRRYENGEWSSQVVDELKEAYGERFDYAGELPQLMEKFNTFFEHRERNEIRPEYEPNERK